MKGIHAKADIIEADYKSKKVSRKHYILKYSLSIVSLMILVVTIKNLYPIITGTYNEINTPTCMVQPEGPIQNLTAQEHIITVKKYGVVSLSSGSTAEIDTLIQRTGIHNNATRTINCYEDKKYTYFFYDDGTVAGMIAKYLYDPNFKADASWSVKKLSEEDALLYL